MLHFYLPLLQCNTSNFVCRVAIASPKNVVFCSLTAAIPPRLASARRLVLCNFKHYSVLGILFWMAAFPALMLFALPAWAEPPQIYANSLGMQFVMIPAGSFSMGSGAEDKDAGNDEKPRHTVTITRAFYLGRFQVTQEQWNKVMGASPSMFQGANNPVEQVSWQDVQEFIRRLNEMEGTGQYRLPTEAEWEYAARAGTTTRYSFGDDAAQLGKYAWYNKNSEKQTKAVGGKRPNPWGLYDMHGNVWEWVQDWYAAYDVSRAGNDPKGPFIGSYRVFRGGSWGDNADYCRSAYRHRFAPGARKDFIGFRLALSPE